MIITDGLPFNSMHLCVCSFPMMMGVVVGQEGVGVGEEVVPPSEEGDPTGCQGVVAVEAREMQDTLGVEVVHILPVVDSAREQVEQDFAKEVVVHLMIVGEEEVVHVPQAPEEGMAQVHLGEEVVEDHHADAEGVLDPSAVPLVGARALALPMVEH